MIRSNESLATALAQFRRKAIYRNFRVLCDSAPQVDEESLSWSELEEAIMSAATADNWRLARAGLDEMWLVHNQEPRKADTIVASLASRHESVRVSAWQAISDRELAQQVLGRLECRPTTELMNFETVMAVDRVIDCCPGGQARRRVVNLMRRLESHGTRSPSLKWKIEDTLYCNPHLGLPRGTRRRGSTR